jgi:hypothetical protein
MWHYWKMIWGEDNFLQSTGLPFLHRYKNSMRNDHVYRDLEYAWDKYIQA